MKKFRLVADITFQAKDLDDASEQIACHFLSVSDDEFSGLEFVGEIHLKPQVEESK